MAEKLEIEVIVNGRKAVATLDEVDRKTDDIGKTTKQTASIINTSWIKIGATLYAVKKAFDMQRDIDNLKTKLEVATGSVEGANKKFEDLKVKANEMGVSFEVLAESYAKFKIASDLVGTASGNTEKIFNSVITASAAMKLSADDTRGVFIALEQMMSKGTVSSEELKQQLGERLPGAFSLAAKAMGVTTQELNKMLEQGQVLATDLLPKLADELQNRFAPAAEAASRSVQASYNRLGNAWTDAQAKITQASAKSGLIDFLAKATSQAGDLVTWIGSIGKTIEEYDEPERILALKNYTEKLNELEQERNDIVQKRGGIFDLFYANTQARIELEIQKYTELVKVLNEVNQKQAGLQPFVTSIGRADIVPKTKSQDEVNIEKKLYDEKQSIRTAFSEELATHNLSDYDLARYYVQKDYEEYSKAVNDKVALEQWRQEELAKIRDQEMQDMNIWAGLQERVIGDLSSGLAEMAMNGKADFADMARAIIQDLIRIQIQAMITSSLTSIGLGGLFGLHTGTTAVKHSGGFIGMPSHHSGSIRQDERIAKLQVGEAVINRAGASRNKEAIASMNAGQKVGGSGSNITTADITFNVTAIDSTSFNSYLVNNRSTIEGIINKSLTTNGSVRQTIKQVV